MTDTANPRLTAPRSGERRDRAGTSPNFGFLAPHEPLLAHLGAQAELYAVQDPNTAIFKVRQFGEALAQRLAARLGIEVGPDANQLKLIRLLETQGILVREVADVFHHIRKSGNHAVHAFRGTVGEAVSLLRMARELSVWYHRTVADPRFAPGPFVSPRPPVDEAAALREEVERLRAEAETARDAAAAAGTEVARAVEEATAQAAQEAEQRLEGLFDAAENEARRELEALAADRDAALALAEEMERALARERERHEAELATLRAAAAARPPDERARDEAQVAEQARAAAVAFDLDEADTRRIIDEQLRAAGWEADSEALTYRRGALPVTGRNVAIAEWPTAHGPADYVLFAGLVPIAVVEAKRRRRNVRGALEQAARYARGYAATVGETMRGPWGEGAERYHIPFLFATNGRGFLRQIVEQSGVWFRDARRATNHPRALDGWYTPGGLLELLRQDEGAADQTLRDTPTDALPLRDYQHAAVRAVERAIAEGRREALIAMATGTGKTRTLLGLVYRLVVTRRFRRVLFLVDRNALGEQALEAVKTVRLEGTRSFADIYDVKELADLTPDADTKLHVSTVQGLLRRLQDTDAGAPLLPVDAYDCVVVDEAHRGYSLDREIGDAELGIRSEADYVSAYRRVLDHFDAVKIGLTATPALHTTQIFGPPVYQYTYRQAVVDGWLVDHEPPVRIETELSRSGIRWRAGEEVPVYHVGRDQVELFTTPDDLGFDVDAFNRQVVTENFNRAVCAALAESIDPAEPGKTLVFAATDAHADMVVRLLTEAFEARYGQVEHGTVAKITGAADDPAALLRRYKNERRPVVAVTVDLLTTGVDVPEIVNLVFLRRVRSRILYEQMLGRATRLRPDLFGLGEDKEVFRIFDAVDLYAALEPHTAMTPVVKSSDVRVADLLVELRRAVDAGAEDAARTIHEQLVAALRRRRRRLERSADDIETLAGGRHAALVEELRRMTPAQAAAWLGERPALVARLDLPGLGERRLVISDHADRVVEVSRGYGSDESGARQRPEDYLEAFGRWLDEHLNELPALLVVTQRPRDLTRADLKALARTLGEAGFTEAQLRAAYRDATNQDVAATIIGYVRQQALGSPLVPYAERVRRAMARILASRAWPDAQRRWLERIGRQLEHEVVVDRAALDRAQFRAAGGGFDRLDRVFGGQLERILGDLQEDVWRDTA
jgi:type I restriction enzyme R subunit